MSKMETVAAPSFLPSKKESNLPSTHPSLRPSTRTTKSPTRVPSPVPSPVASRVPSPLPSPLPSPVPFKRPSFPSTTVTEPPSEAPTKSDCDLDSIHNDISTIRLDLIPNSDCANDITCNEYGFHTTTLQWSVRNENNVDLNNIHESYPKEIRKVTREVYCLDPTSCYKMSISLSTNNPSTDTTNTDTSKHMKNTNNSLFLPSYELRINDALQAKEIIQLNESIEHYIGSSCHNKESGQTTIPTLPPSEKSSIRRTKWSEVTIPLCIFLFFLLLSKRYYSRRRIIENRRRVEERNRNVNSRNRSRRRRWNEEYGVDGDVGDGDDDDGNYIFDIGMDGNSRFEDQYIMDERQVRRLIILKNLIYKVCLLNVF